nr:FecR domain-containing protein [Desulfobulbaceae bacterium]
MQLLLSLTIIILLLPSSLLAADNLLMPVASVIALRGDVQAINKDGLSRQLHIKDPLQLHDSIRTGINGRLQILFTDNTIISLGTKSIFEISDYYLADDKTGKLTTTVSEGVFRVMGGILTKTSPNKFITETPSGNIGIRGSMYAAQVTGSNLSVVFEGGSGITVSNNTGIVTISEPGSGTNTSGINQPIQAPHIFSDAELNFVRQNLSLSRHPTNSPAPNNQNLQVTPQFSPGDINSPKEPSAQISPVQNSNSDQTEESLTDSATENEFESDFVELSNQIKNNQEIAAQIFRNAVSNRGMAVDSALNAVLIGMTNSNKIAFDSLMNEAIEMGITAEQAREIAKSLRSSDVCK